MQLSLDHLIIRSVTPEATLALLSARAGTPRLTGVEHVRGISSGIVRAGTLDIEVLSIGAEPPEVPHGYGIGLVADRGLDGAITDLRSLGFATSPAPRVSLGNGIRRRAWRASQVVGLLPDPFPTPASGRRRGVADRMSDAAAGGLTRIPAVARAATRCAGRSMVVLTEYDFDVRAWRASVDPGPAVLAIHIGTGGHRADWERLPFSGRVRLYLSDEGPAGIRRVVLAGDRSPFSVGDVAFEFSG